MKPLWKMEAPAGYTPSIVEVTLEEDIHGVGLRIFPLSLNFHHVRQHWKKLREEMPNDGDLIFTATFMDNGSLRFAEVCFGKVTRPIRDDQGSRLILEPFIETDDEANILKKYDGGDSYTLSTNTLLSRRMTEYWINVEDVAGTLLSGGNYKIDVEGLRKAVDSEKHPTTKALEIMKFFDAGYYKAVQESHDTLRMTHDTASRKGKPFGNLPRDAIDNVLTFVGKSRKEPWRKIDRLSKTKTNPLELGASEKISSVKQHRAYGGRRSRKRRRSRRG